MKKMFDSCKNVNSRLLHNVSMPSRINILNTKVHVLDISLSTGESVSVMPCLEKQSIGNTQTNYFRPENQ